MTKLPEFQVNAVVIAAIHEFFHARAHHIGVSGVLRGVSPTKFATNALCAFS
jgi:hypothetical protein